MFNKLKQKLVTKLKYILLNHDIKQGNYDKPKYICDRLETRNRYKNEESKIPFDKPQCPVFNDNRCCGGCDLVETCDYTVNCGCFGFVYAAMGATDDRYYLNKSSEYKTHGKLDQNGKFDWDAYKINKFKSKFALGKYIKIQSNDKKAYALIKSKINPLTQKFKVFVPEQNKHMKITFKDVIDYTPVLTKEEYERYQKLGI